MPINFNLYQAIATHYIFQIYQLDHYIVTPTTHKYYGYKNQYHMIEKSDDLIQNTVMNRSGTLHSFNLFADAEQVKEGDMVHREKVIKANKNGKAYSAINSSDYLSDKDSQYSKFSIYDLPSLKFNHRISVFKKFLEQCYFDENQYPKFKDDILLKNASGKIFSIKDIHNLEKPIESEEIKTILKKFDHIDAYFSPKFILSNLNFFNHSYNNWNLDNIDYDLYNLVFDKMQDKNLIKKHLSQIKINDFKLERFYQLCSKYFQDDDLKKFFIDYFSSRKNTLNKDHKYSDPLIQFIEDYFPKAKSEFLFLKAIEKESQKPVIHWFSKKEYHYVKESITIDQICNSLQNKNLQPFSLRQAIKAVIENDKDQFISITFKENMATMLEIEIKSEKDTPYTKEMLRTSLNHITEFVYQYNKSPEKNELLQFIEQQKIIENLYLSEEKHQPSTRKKL